MTRPTKRTAPTTTPPTPEGPLLSTTAGEGALARCVGETEPFLAERFGRDPYRTTADAGFDDLLSLDDVDEILAGRGLRHPDIRLVRDGEVIDTAEWTHSARTGGTKVEGLVHSGKTLEHFADGATVVLQSLHRWWPPLSRFCRDLELELGHPVQANAYLTPPGAAGLTPHHDTHDVFVLQCHGEKEWVLREAVVESPITRQRSDHDEAAEQPVLSEEHLRAGDCLYLPRGVVHSARTQTGASLHVTIGIRAITAHDLLHQLADAAAEDARFRRTLPVGFGVDEKLAGDTVRELAGEFARWLDDLDPEPLATDAVDRFVRRRNPAERGQLRTLLELDDVDLDTTVTLRPGTIWRATIEPAREEGDDGDRVHVTAGDRRLDLPAGAETAVRRLLDGDEHRVRDLTDLLDDDSSLVLVRRLLREGLLVTTGTTADTSSTS